MIETYRAIYGPSKCPWCVDYEYNEKFSKLLRNKTFWALDNWAEKWLPFWKIGQRWHDRYHT